MNRRRPTPSSLFAVLVGMCLFTACTQNSGGSAESIRTSVHLGPRPFYLVDQLDDGALKDALQNCRGPLEKSDFSIGHRGAPLQFPEHTRESYLAAARMGAGILECDVTFTADGKLVCRHAQCSLQTTTDVLVRPDLAAKCSEPFRPAEVDAAGEVLRPATARCCTSDFTLEEFKSLCGKMDAFNPAARTPQEFQSGTADWRTDLYSNCGTLLSHAESIRLFQELQVKFAPELKEGRAEDIELVFGNREALAQALIDEYHQAGVLPEHVFPQSFHLEDMLYWISEEPSFGRQAVFLDKSPIPHPDPRPHLQDLASHGIRIVAPSMSQLLDVADGEIVPSSYATAAQAAGLDIISWTTERSGRIHRSSVEGGSFYYQTTLDVLGNDAAILETIDVLAQDVGVIGIFSDWPATTTLYANCRLK